LGVSCDDVVRLKAILFDARQIQRARRITHDGKLWAQVFGRRIAIGFVLIVNLVPKRLALGVKNDREIVVRMILDQPQHHGHKTTNRANGRTV